MDCPDCSSTDTRVTDSRPGRDAVRRRRRCEACGQRFTTHERPVLPADDVEQVVLSFVRSLDPQEMTPHG